MSFLHSLFKGDTHKYTHDCLSIGDTAVDAFIRLQQAEEIIDLEHHRDMLCMSFAEKIPYDFAEVIPGVGNSANAAVSLARLGLKSAIYTNLGDDAYAQDCISSFKQNHVDTSYIVKNKGKKTNYHYVLWFKNERTILIKHFEYPYMFPQDICPRYIYLSSISATGAPFHDDIVDFLKRHPETKLVFQPGTFQINLGKDKLKELYERTEIFACNKEEAEKILGIEAALGDEHMKKLLTEMRKLGPKTAIITDGPKGAYASNGTEIYFAVPYPDPKEPYERTGAGDAFASTTVGALMLDKDLGKALEWGSVNSMSVTQEIGAQRGLLPQEKIEEYLRQAPPGWGAVKI